MDTTSCWDVRTSINTVAAIAENLRDIDTSTGNGGVAHNTVSEVRLTGMQTWRPEAVLFLARVSPIGHPKGQREMAISVFFSSPTPTAGAQVFITWALLSANFEHTLPPGSPSSPSHGLVLSP